MHPDKKIILIVDDEADLTWSMTRHIKRENPNHYVYSAVTGLQAFEMLESIQPDLLITDLRMPGMSGMKLIEKARQFNPGIKVIVISAYYSREIEKQLRTLGINEFIEKPFELKFLCSLSDSLLANPVYDQTVHSHYQPGLAN